MRVFHPHLNPPLSRGRRRGMDSRFRGNDRIRDGLDKSGPYILVDRQDAYPTLETG